VQGVRSHCGLLTSCSLPKKSSAAFFNNSEEVKEKASVSPAVVRRGG